MNAAPVKILIVDDDKADAMLVQHEVERIKFAHRITCVHDRNAFKRELAQPPDIILSDFSMPGFGALALLEELQAVHCDIPVIIVSGAIGEEAAVAAMKLGAVDYLLKDRLGRLPAAIEQVVELQRLNRAERATAEKLQRSEALLHIASRLGRIGAWTIDLPGMKLTWSDEVRAIYEVPPAYEPTFETALDFYAPEHRPRAAAAFAECLTHGTSFDLELEVVTARGRRIWVRAIAEAARDETGAIQCIRGAVQDVSDQVNAARQTRQMAARLAATFESITDAFFTLDTEWRFTEVNREAERLLKKPRAEMLGKIVWDVFPEARDTTFDQKYRQAVAQQTTESFEEYYPPLERWLEVRAYPSPQGLAVYFTDITPRRHIDFERADALARERAAREEAEAAKAHFRTLFEFIPGLYLVLTPEDYTVVAVSEAYLHATMTTREQLMGHQLFDLFPANPDEENPTGSDDLQPSLERVKRTRQADSVAVHRYPLRRPVADGGGFEERYWSMMNSPVFGPTGELAYIIHRTEDLTEFVRLRQRAGAWEEGERTLLSKLEQMEADLVVRATDVLKLNEQLHVSEEQFRGMFVNAATGIAIFNATQTFLRANPALCAITGYTEDELRTMQLHALITPEDWPQHERAIQRLLDHQIDSTGIEARYTRKSGGVIWINGSLSVVRKPDGEPLHVILVIEEITGRKEAEFALRERERHYRLLFDRNPQPMWVFDQDTKRFLAINAAAVEKYGYSEKEFLAMSIEDIRPPADVPQLRESLSHGFETKNIGIWRHRTKNGTLIDVELTADSLTFAGRPARLILANDITERLRSQQQIARQAALIDQANDAIIVRGLDDTIEFWNKGAERIFGWTAAEVLGQSNRSVIGQPSEDLAAAIRQLRETGDWSGELRDVTKDGRIIAVATRWTLLRDESGAPRAILAIKSDITEQKKIETQFLRAQRLESIGTLAGGIAHDLNNLLAPIIMGAGLMKHSPLSSANRRVVETIERSAERGTHLVRQVLFFARGIEGARVQLDVRQLVEEMELIIANTFPKNIIFTTDLLPEVPLISGDPTQINQVLLNLCVNARDAMPSGGQLTIAAREVNLDEQFVAPYPGVSAGRFVVIEVADTGTGIPPEILEKIFEPFFTTKELGRGTGLGLSTTLGIVRSHDGLLNVSSQPGRGSVFKIYLPVPAAANDIPAPALPTLELPRGHGEWILLVDDEASIRSITQQTLEAFGYQVRVAEHGAAAINEFVSSGVKFQLVITDLMMPVMDGHALIATLWHIDPGLPIIASSGLQSRADVDKATGAGVRQFITKPFSAEVLLRAVEAGLNYSTLPLSPKPNQP